MNYQKARYLKGAAKITDLPADEGVEVAFAGRSNAGKSSAINALVKQKALARVSKTPGRTQLLNFFSLSDTQRLVDLPGYGYAKVSATMQASWQQTMAEYLYTRQTLKGVVLLMDARHAPHQADQMMIDLLIDCQRPVHVLLTKSDKLNQQQKSQVLEKVTKWLAPLNLIYTCQLYAIGNEKMNQMLREQLDSWYTFDV